MAGHSKFKNIMHRKGAQDLLKAKLFAKLSREISVATRIGGSEVESNIRLKSAINSAKVANMPKENISRAIKKGEGSDSYSNYFEVRYEGYGPGGTAIIVETLTNNKNRTASEIRTTFSKNGGTLGETGSVSHNFTKLGNIIIGKNIGKESDIFNFAIECGSVDFESNEDDFSIFCDIKDYNDLIQKFTSKFGNLKSNQLIWRSKTKVKLGIDNAQILFKLINTLEDNEDVQNISSNFEINEEIMNQLIN
tara:strand:+ start:142 stop:891 length:750 start_codon:yes stop_codon:yes gene_type:complete